MLGRRRKKEAGGAEAAADVAVEAPVIDAEPAEAPVLEAPAADAPADDAAPAEPVAVDRSAGPLDSAEAAADPERIVLGALALPVADGTEIRLEIDKESQNPVAVTVVGDTGALQLRVFAAPRSGGLWDELRADIERQLVADGGRVRLASTHFGVEVQAEMPAPGPQGKGRVQPMRVVGVEGPRWLLQGLFLGAAALPQAAQFFDDIFRSVVVQRGDSPMPPGAPLPLALPPEMDPADQDAAGAGGDGAAPGDRGDIADPFERGPEITEIR